MHTEQERVLSHNQKIERDFKEMSKRSANFEKMYRALKAQQINGNVEIAAEHDADNVIQGASQNPGGQYRSSHQQQAPSGFPRRSNSNGSGGSDERRRMTLQPGTGYSSQGYVPLGSRRGMTSSREYWLPCHSCCTTDMHQTADLCQRTIANACQRIYLSPRLVRTMQVYSAVKLEVARIGRGLH